MAAKHVTTASFQSDVLSSSKPVLVDFWATRLWRADSALDSRFALTRFFT